MCEAIFLQSLPNDSVEALNRDRGYLVSYMPFAGVRYYRWLGESDLHSERMRIGPVGWRRADTTTHRVSVPAAA
jgi:hypothetical protein